ncbi:MAG: hypothetical protein N2322_02920, partial [Terrimicrobiaceae bacterium]|nr:hypothetical protein [Terrimicrobiaceae bacterium]
RGMAAFSTNAADDMTRYRFIAVAQTRDSRFGAGDALVEVSKPLMVEPALPRFLRAGDEVQLRAVVRQDEEAPSRGEMTLLVEGSGTGAAQNVAFNLDGKAPAALSFPASAGSSPGTLTVRFSARTPSAADAVAVTLPVLPATGRSREAVSGNWTGSFSPPEMPEAWKAPGAKVSLSVSTTPWLPLLRGLPMIVEYPHGCFEQKSAKVLALTALNRLSAFIPLPRLAGDRAAAVIENVLSEMDRSLLPNGLLPYWPGSSEPCPLTTIQCAWCAQAAERQGIQVPQRLAEALPDSLRKLADGTAQGAAPALRAMAIFVGSLSANPSAFQEAAQELFRQRDKLDADARLFLALALRSLTPDRGADKTLLAGLPEPPDEFDPRTFASPARTRALRALAEGFSDSAQATESLRALLAQATELSTQENLWVLMAASQLIPAAAPIPLPRSGLKPEPEARSTNLSAAYWTNTLTPAGLPKLRGEGSWIAEAELILPPDAPPVSRGLRIERILTNLTNPSRDGSAAHPFAIGDEIAIGYRLFSEQPRVFAVLEEPLPAALEPLHPATRQPPPSPSAPPPAPLSHTELHDDRVALFFDTLPAGTSSAALVARVTSQGSFAWPQATLTPMYDSRAFARTSAATLVTVAQPE